MFSVGVTGRVWHWEKNIKGVHKKSWKNIRSEILTKQNEKLHVGKEFLGTAPTFAWLNPSAFLSVGRHKALVYSVAIEKEGGLHQHV